MADTVSTKVIINNTVDYVVQLMNRSDGTGESAVVKIDKSTLTGPGGAEPSSLRIRKIKYDCNGMGVDLFWDHTSDVKFASLGSGHGCFDYNDVGGLTDTGSGDTGDVLLTTAGHTAGDSYMIILYCEKVQ